MKERKKIFIGKLLFAVGKSLQLINIIMVRINYIFWGIIDIRVEGNKFIK